MKQHDERAKPMESVCGPLTPEAEEEARAARIRARGSVARSLSKIGGWPLCDPFRDPAFKRRVQGRRKAERK